MKSERRFFKNICGKSLMLNFIVRFFANSFAFLFLKKKKLFIDVLKEYFDKRSTDALKPGTKIKHHYFFENIERYMKYAGLIKMPAEHIKVKHMEHMRTWLINRGHNKRCSREHASRHVELCIAAMDWAVMMEHVEFNRLSPIKGSRDKPIDIVLLNDKEIKEIIKCTFKSTALNNAKDLFLFQCFTGLSYVDLWTYELVEIEEITLITNKSGRGKNGNIYWAHFNSHAKSIYEKYGGELPQISNQLYNQYIKKIAAYLNIDKDLSSHNARKTYATLKYKKGHSLESIADEMGNSPEILLKHYIGKSADRVVSEIRKLKDVPLLDI